MSHVDNFWDVRYKKWVLVIRNARENDASAIAEVHVKTWQSAYTNILPLKFLNNLTNEIPQRESRWREQLNKPEIIKTTFVAEENGQVIGFARGNQSRDPAYSDNCELYAIYILLEAQGKGLGKKLTKTLIKTFLELGFSSMLVWVFEENHSARKFYEAMGGSYLSKKQIVIDGSSYPEVSYKWNDLRKLA